MRPGCRANRGAGRHRLALIAPGDPAMGAPLPDERILQIQRSRCPRRVGRVTPGADRRIDVEMAVDDAVLGLDRGAPVRIEDQVAVAADLRPAQVEHPAHAHGPPLERHPAVRPQVRAAVHLAAAKPPGDARLFQLQAPQAVGLAQVEILADRGLPQDQAVLLLQRSLVQRSPVHAVDIGARGVLVLVVDGLPVIETLAAQRDLAAGLAGILNDAVVMRRPPGEAGLGRIDRAPHRRPAQAHHAMQFGGAVRGRPTARETRLAGVAQGRLLAGHERDVAADQHLAHVQRIVLRDELGRPVDGVPGPGPQGDDLLQLDDHGQGLPRPLQRLEKGRDRIKQSRAGLVAGPQHGARQAHAAADVGALEAHAPVRLQVLREQVADDLQSIGADGVGPRAQGFGEDDLQGPVAPVRPDDALEVDHGLDVVARTALLDIVAFGMLGRVGGQVGTVKLQPRQVPVIGAEALMTVAKALEPRADGLVLDLAHPRFGEHVVGPLFQHRERRSHHRPRQEDRTMSLGAAHRQAAPDPGALQQHLVVDHGLRQVENAVVGVFHLAPRHLLHLGDQGVAGVENAADPRAREADRRNHGRPPQMHAASRAQPPRLQPRQRRSRQVQRDHLALVDHQWHVEHAADETDREGQFQVGQIQGGARSAPDDPAADELQPPTHQGLVIHRRQGIGQPVGHPAKRSEDDVRVDRDDAALVQLQPREPLVRRAILHAGPLPGLDRVLEERGAGQEAEQLEGAVVEQFARTVRLAQPLALIGREEERRNMPWPPKVRPARPPRVSADHRLFVATHAQTRRRIDPLARRHGVAERRLLQLDHSFPPGKEERVSPKVENVKTPPPFRATKSARPPTD